MAKKLQDKWPSFFKNKIARGKQPGEGACTREIEKAHQPIVIRGPYLGLYLNKPTLKKLLRMYYYLFKLGDG